MYSLGVRRDFSAAHYLVGGDWGDENRSHFHHYMLEVTLEGEKLDSNGFLVDIVDIEALLDRLIAHYRNKTLNHLPEFKGLNPSLEHFARILCRSLLQAAKLPHLSGISVKLWEDETAWAAFREAC